MFRRAELIDARGATGPGPSVTELWQLADHARRLMAGIKPGPRAIVVEHWLHYWTARVFSNFLTGPLAIEVFQSEPAARRWLLAHSPANSSPDSDGPGGSVEPVF